MRRAIAEVSPILREQNFTVVIARHVFAHKEHGIVFVRDPLSLAAAKQYGLQPLLLYSLGPAVSLFRCNMLTPVDRPLGLGTALQRMWQSCSELRGVPDVLRTSQHVATACPSLADMLRHVGVNLVVADGHDKRFGAFVRNAQQETIGFLSLHAISNINALNAALLERVTFDARRSNLGASSVREAMTNWLALPAMPQPIPFQNGGEWTQGLWLHSWEASLPPSGSRYFYTGQEGNHWLLAGMSETSEDESDDVNEERDDNNLAELVKTMVGAWPNSATEIARAASITARELRWFMSGQADLSLSGRTALRTLLGIEYRDSIDAFEASAPCVIIAKERAATAAYEELSHGGDLVFSFEAIPDGDAADPSWRYILFKAYGCAASILMLARGGKLTPTSKLFINLDEVARVVPVKLYRDIVATAARACLRPGANIAEMCGFNARHDAVLDEFDGLFV